MAASESLPLTFDLSACVDRRQTSSIPPHGGCPIEQKLHGKSGKEHPRNTIHLMEQQRCSQASGPLCAECKQEPSPVVLFR